jgi:hypothetical protein
MGKETEVRINLDGLTDFKKKIGDTYRARIGILGNNATRGGKGEKLNNAQIGVIQMFGTLDGRIPPRDFLILPMQVGQKQLLGTMGTSVVRAAVESGDIKKVFQLLGQAGRALVLQAFQTGGFGQWKSNKPSTIARKGSAAPLIDTGQLMRSIDSDVVKKGGGSLPSRTA